MSEANGEVDVSVEARALGWLPEAEFKGDKSRWIDADEYVKRGHQIMPLLQRNNKDLVGKLTRTETALETQTRAVAELRESMASLVKFQAAEVKRQVEEKLATLKAGRALARKEGDDDAVSALEDQIDDAKDKLRELTAAEKAEAKPDQGLGGGGTVEPWAREFVNANPWLQTDKRKAGMFVAICNDIFEKKGLVRGELLEAGKKELEEILGGKTAPSGGGDDGDQRASKAEDGSSRGSGGGGGGGGGGKSYANLPADAKAVCDRQAKDFVGKNKAFADKAAWQKHYASIFFESN